MEVKTRNVQVYHETGGRLRAYLRNVGKSNPQAYCNSLAPIPNFLAISG
jgi:hypothetical protein